jgi:hypothetical protein
MRRAIFLAVLATALIATVALADHPIVDKVAEKVIQKYQTSSCEQLAAEKAEKQGKPKPQMEQRAIQMLHQDAAARAEFFNKISAPVVTKLFECGMIP